MKNIFFLLAGILLFTKSINAQTIYYVSKTGDYNSFLYQYNYVDSLCDTTMYGTLQWAVRKANDTPGSSEIHFAIPGAGPHTIFLSYELPVLINTTKVDGTTQSGYQYGQPSVILDGQNLISTGIYYYNIVNPVVKGLRIQNFTIQGILFNQCRYGEISENIITGISNGASLDATTGIRLINTNNIHFNGNYIGTDFSESSGMGCDDYGILVQIYASPQQINGGNNFIGGSGLGQGNIIAYNGVNGIWIAQSANNLISRNRLFNNPVAIRLTQKANQNIQPPVITSATINTVSGTSAPNDIIEIFGSTGSENANEYLTTTQADGSGNWGTSVNTFYNYVVASARDGSNNTSMLSNALQKQILSTKLISTDCGATEVNFDQTLTATEIIGASLYIFHVINYNLGFDFTVSKTLNSFSLSELNQQIYFNTPYLINVSVVLGQDTLNSPDTCIVNTFDPDQDFNNYQNQVIYDRFGSTYTLEEITKKPDDTNSFTVIAGRFALTFTDPVIYTPQVVETITQVFDDIDIFITSQSCGTDLPNDIPFVNIQINAPSNMPPGNPGAAITSSFYAPLLQACCNPNIENSGVIESEVWRAVNTGINDPLLFDGFIDLNFYSPNWTFNIDLLTPTSVNPPQIDLYTVVLHETLHLFGFASLIGNNGLSIFAPNFNMYSRYDLFLNDNSGVNFIDWPSPYVTVFSVPIASLSANCIDIRFQGTNTFDEPITNVNTGALSHIDDGCPGIINEPMTPGLSYGEEKRTITPRDANILLDLGYQLTGSFGDGSLPFHVGGLPFGGPGVIGRPDGLNGFNANCASAYQLELCNPGTDQIVINDIFPNTFLSNDFNAVGFEGLELLQGNAAFVEDHTTNQITVTPNTPGLIIFRYVPLDASVNRGNYTCIYINVNPCQNCLVPDDCELICNPGMNCFTPNCYPTGSWGQLPQNWMNSHGSVDWFNWNWVNAPDPGYLRMATHWDASMPMGWSEGIITNVNVIAGNVYMFSYWRRRGGDILGETLLENVFVRLFNSPNPLIPTNLHETPDVTLISNQLILNEQQIVDLDWEQVLVCFTANANYNTLWIYPQNILGSPENSNTATLYIDRIQLAPFNPDFAGTDIASACANNVTIGTAICTVDNMQFEWSQNGIIIGNTEQLQVPGDVDATYDLQLILPANPVTVVFPTGGNNCIVTDQVIVDFTGGINVNTNVYNDICGLCNGSATVTPVNGMTPYTYLWDAQSGGGIFSTATNLCAGNYTVTVTDANGCSVITPIVITSPGLLNSTITQTDITCNGGNIGAIDLTVTDGTSPYSYSWTGPGGPYSTEDLSGLAQGIYYVTVTDANGCTWSGNSTIIEDIFTANWPVVIPNTLGNEQIYDMAYDGQGNIYAVGLFTRNVTLGSNTYNVSAPNVAGIFVAKYDYCGNFVNGNVYGYVVYNASKATSFDYHIEVLQNGKIVVAGDFNTANFTTNPANLMSTNVFGDVFLAYLNPLTLWCDFPQHQVRISGFFSDRVIGISEYNNSVLITGHFNSDYISLTPFLYTHFRNNNHRDIFIARYDWLSGNPSLIWVNSYNISNFNDKGMAAEYVPGGSPSFIYFTYSNTSSYIVRVDASNGIAVGAPEPIGNTGYFEITDMTSFAGNLYLCGFKQNSFNSQGTRHAAVISYWNLSNISWSNAIADISTPVIPGNRKNIANKIVANTNGVYVAGTFGQNNFSFDPSLANFLNPAGNANHFVAKFNSALTFQWQTGVLSGNTSRATSLVYDSQRNMYYIGGSFNGTVDLNNINVPGQIIGPSISNDAFIARFEDINTAAYYKIFEVNTDSLSNSIYQSLELFPNPTNGKVKITSVYNDLFYKIAVTDITGRNVYVKSFTEDTFSTEIDLSFLLSNTYIVSILTQNEVYNRKLIIVK